ncbi:MAG: hypothetical protein ACRENE_27505 [Polyangiaceae bacterium]
MGWLEDLAAGMAVGAPRPALSPSLVFDDVRAAIAMVEEAIAERRGATQDEGMARAVKAAQDPFHDYVREPVSAPMAATMWKSALTFPRILRGAMLISVGSHVEHVLRSWCSLLEKRWSLPKPLGPKPRGASDLQNCMTYLRDVAGLALADYPQWKEWEALDAYRVARNRLAHNGGIVLDPDEQRKVSALPCMKVETFGLLADEPSIFIDEGACEAAADNARAFFDRLSTICAQDVRAK